MTKFHLVSKLKTILALLLLSAKVWAHAGPPMVTDDPGTPGDGKWEINMALTSASGGGESHFETPLLDLNYGWGEHVQLKYEVPWVISRDDQDSDSSQKTGFDRSTVGVKYRFYDNEETALAVSTYPQFAFRTPVSGELRNRDTETNSEPFLPFEVEEGLGKFQLNQELGYRWEESDESRLVMGLSLSYNPTEATAFYAEIHQEMKVDGSARETLWNLGLAQDLNPTLAFLFSFGQTLTRFEEGQSPQSLVYLAAQLHL